MPDFFGALRTLLRDWIFWLVDWMISFAKDIVVMLLEMVMWIVPAGWQGYASELLPWLGLVNYWVALDLWATTAGLYMTVRAVVLTARITIKILPFTG